MNWLKFLQPRGAASVLWASTMLAQNRQDAERTVAALAPYIGTLARSRVVHTGTGRRPSGTEPKKLRQAPKFRFLEGAR